MKPDDRAGSASTREKHPQIPWATVMGMRHRLVHAYFDIDLDLVWSTATEAAPALLAQVKPLLDLD
jgi:uncharacterized protein with HEPN domain